jgi:hypothetical protein
MVWNMMGLVKWTLKPDCLHDANTSGGSQCRFSSTNSAMCVIIGRDRERQSDARSARSVIRELVVRAMLRGCCFARSVGLIVVMRRRILTILTVTCVAGAAISAAMRVRSLFVFDELTWTGPTERWLLSSAHAQLAFTISGGADWTGEPRFGRSVGSPKPDSLTGARDAGWSQLRTHVERGGFVLWAGSDGNRFVKSVVVPWWSVTSLMLLLPGYRLGRTVLRVRAPGRCARCGYDLRATPDRCPECGAVSQGRPAAA